MNASIIDECRSSIQRLSAQGKSVSFNYGYLAGTDEEWVKIQVDNEACIFHNQYMQDAPRFLEWMSSIS